MCREKRLGKIYRGSFRRNIQEKYREMRRRNIKEKYIREKSRENIWGSDYCGRL